MIGDHPIELLVEPTDGGLRLDQFVCRRIPGISRGSVRRLLEQRQVLVEGRPQPKGTRLREGQQVLVAAAAHSERPVPQPALPLEILAVRQEMVVINKAAGMPCHPLVPGETDTVANALAARFPECVTASSHSREGGLVHRLDWSTSGLLLAARSPTAYGRLRGAFSGGRVTKHYLALVQGHLQQHGAVSSHLSTMPGDRTRMQVVVSGSAGRAAQTRFWPLEQLEQHTVVHVTCTTGLRHQVRVHLAHTGHPLAGDDHYGGDPLDDNEGAFLHAARLVLTDDGLTFEAPLPAARRQVLERLGARVVGLPARVASP